MNEKSKTALCTSPEVKSPKLTVAAPRVLTSSPWAVVPPMSAFLLLYWAYLARPEEYGWVASSWPLAIVSAALAVVSVSRRRYDGWSSAGDRVEVVRDRLVRTYARGEMESVEFRKFFTGLASVRDEAGRPDGMESPWGCHVEVTVKMKNGDRTTALMPAGDPELERIRSWCPSPAPPR